MDWYGLSCFEKLSVKSEEERGVRMKCVGVLAESYHSLGMHMGYLQQQVRCVVAAYTLVCCDVVFTLNGVWLYCRHQLEHQQDYGPLQDYIKRFSIGSRTSSNTFKEESSGNTHVMSPLSLVS